MKIIFITNEIEDYLADSILHGLKKIYGSAVVDYPFKDILYSDCPVDKRRKIRGNGFTLYFLLDSSTGGKEIDLKDSKTYKFNYIIFSSIHRQYELYLQLFPSLKSEQTIIMDGEDTPAIFPYYGYFWRRPKYWFIPKPHRRFLYFKREWTQDTKLYRYYKLIPKPLLKIFPEPKNLKRISFSIPEEKIVKDLPIKTKLFPKHIVDEEVAARVDGSFIKYAFDSERDYYADLQSSKYGITTKRAGWDCMRHYEIAANCAVICFKDLDKKPVTCAPHGLVAGLKLYFIHEL